MGFLEIGGSLDALKNDHFKTALAFWMSLYALGVRRVFFSPGSRSAPLVFALSHLKASGYDFTLCRHFDERGMAFFALGATMTDLVPSVVFTTSGSAVANLLPAITEADAQHIPLILLTADRPLERLDIGANQTMPQSGIFAPFVRFSASLPAEHLSAEILSDMAAELVSRATSPLQRGPVHLNWSLREPLYPDSPLSLPDLPLPVRKRVHAPAAPAAVPYAPESLEKVLIFVGRLDTFTPAEKQALSKVLSRLELPILTDIASGLRFCLAGGLDMASALLEKAPFSEAQTIIHLGAAPTDLRLSSDLASLPARHLRLALPRRRVNPHLFSEEFEGDPLPFLSRLSNDKAWKMRFWEKSKEAAEGLVLSCGEAALARKLPDSMPKDAQLFVGNSLPIRFMDALSAPSSRGIMLYQQRGVSGIDGQIATAAGVALSSQKPLVLVMGEQSCLYDLTSLLLISQYALPLTVIVVNNGGGGIFDYVAGADVLDSAGRDCLREHFVAAHSMNFSKIAKAMEMDYQLWEGDSVIQHLQAENAFFPPRFIEVSTGRGEGARFLKSHFTRD